jgi:hypothetical protein
MQLHCTTDSGAAVTTANGQLPAASAAGTESIARCARWSLVEVNVFRAIV